MRLLGAPTKERRLATNDVQRTGASRPSALRIPLGRHLFRRLAPTSTFPGCACGRRRIFAVRPFNLRLGSPDGVERTATCGPHPRRPPGRPKAPRRAWPALHVRLIPPSMDRTPDRDRGHHRASPRIVSPPAGRVACLPEEARPAQNAGGARKARRANVHRPRIRRRLDADRRRAPSDRAPERRVSQHFMRLRTWVRTYAGMDQGSARSGQPGQVRPICFIGRIPPSIQVRMGS